MTSPQNEKQKDSGVLKAGDSVVIASRFFTNRGMKAQSMSIGTIIGFIKPTEKILPGIVIRFVNHPIFFENEYLKKLLAGEQVPNSLFVELIIHPVYIEKFHVEKIRRKYGKVKNNKRISTPVA